MHSQSLSGLSNNTCNLTTAPEVIWHVWEVPNISRMSCACSSYLTPSVTGKTYWWIWLHSRQQFQSLVLINKSKEEQHIPTVLAKGNQHTTTQSRFWHFHENPKLLPQKRTNSVTKVTQSASEKQYQIISALYKTRPKKKKLFFLFNPNCDTPQCLSQGLYWKS